MGPHSSYIFTLEVIVRLRLEWTLSGDLDDNNCQVSPAVNLASFAWNLPVRVSKSLKTPVDLPVQHRLTVRCGSPGLSST